MYVCICKKVTDREIQRAVADGARHMRDLQKQFELGTQCGKCCACARSLLKTLDSTSEAYLPQPCPSA